MKRVTHLFVPSLTGCLLVASLLSSCTGIHGSKSVPSAGRSQPNASSAEPPLTTRVQVGVASWYGKEFHGRPTASGEIYDMYQPTAAHLTAPLGTYALVTNLENGQSVRVRINDRGPYKYRRILDLSYEAARQLDLVRAGTGRVQIDFLTEPALVVPPTAGPALVVPPTVTSVDTSPDQRNSVQVLETRAPNDRARDQIRIAGRREGAVVVIEVSDTGPGIPEKARAHLFEAFQGSTRPGGSGLGLAIAAELVRAHGGEIRLVDGTLGATFRIIIPDRAVDIGARRGERARA